MRTDTAEIERTPACCCVVKVHGAICTQLEILIERITRVFPKIVDSRPRCSSGMIALCQIQNAMGTAKQLLEYCSESSRFYLALTGDKIVKRFRRTKQKLEENLSKLQTMVPRILEVEISQIVDDLRRAVFIIGSSEQEAAKALQAIFEKDESILSSFGNSQIGALRFVASRLHLTSLKDLLLERRAIHKMLKTVKDSEQPKERILFYFKCFLNKYGKQILEGQEYYASMNNDESFFSMVPLTISLHDDSLNSCYGSIPRTSNFDGSFGSLAGLHLQLDISNLSLGHQTNPEFKFFSSKDELEITLLSNINLLPWESQFRGVEDVQSYLDCYSHAPVPLSLKNFVDPLGGFLRTAVARQDKNAQAIATHLFSTGVNVSRSAIRVIDEEMYLLLASFLGTSATKDVLGIFQSSIQTNCSLKLAQSGALTSILRILDSQYTEFHKPAVKLLLNLSSSTQDPSLVRFMPIGCIPKLAFFLQDSALSLPSIQIMERLCRTDEARLLATETNGCVESMVGLLDTGNCEEQQYVMDILLGLCSRCRECCQLVMEEGIYTLLMCIQVIGNERAKASSGELLKMLRAHSEEE